MFKIKTTSRAAARDAHVGVGRAGVLAALVATGLVGPGVVAAGASAATAPQTVTLGTTVGNPSANICAASINCTYVPFSGVSTPELQVPFDATVTTFSVNAGSAGGSVELRVLRPAGGGQYTGAGTSPAETLKLGMNTFAVSLPVKSGDVLGLDNSSSALVFDTTSSTAITAYYEVPALADGATAAPNRIQSGYRPLMSATIESTATSTTTTTPPAGTAPRISGVRQSHKVWRERTAPSRFSRARKVPVGTAFSFQLNEPARLSFDFTRHLAGRRIHGGCAPGTNANRTKPVCDRSVPAGVLQFAAHAGTNRVLFQGRIGRSRALAPGRYTVRIIATNSAGPRSNAASLAFTIVK